MVLVMVLDESQGQSGNPGSLRGWVAVACDDCTKKLCHDKHELHRERRQTGIPVTGTV